MPENPGEHGGADKNTAQSPWQNKAKLRELYEEEQLSQKQIADRLGCAESTVNRWLSKHNIESRSPASVEFPILRNATQLREWHYEDGLTMSEIAEKIGSSSSNVSLWFKRHGITPNKELIERRRREEARQDTATFKIDRYGYVIATSRFKGKTDQVRLHRLLAAAEFGMEELEGKIVHHKKNIPWLNTPDNLEIMTWEEHGRHHHAESGGGDD